MAILDRSMVKWQAAFQLLELVKTQRDLWRDTEREKKPIIDEHEAEEFDLRIIYAMEHNHSVKLTIGGVTFNKHEKCNRPIYCAVDVDVYCAVRIHIFGVLY